MKKNNLLIAAISTLLFLGAGCSWSGNKTETTPTSTPEEPVIDTTVQQQAYLFCIQKNYDIQIRYDSAKNRNIAYCVFDKDTECESVAFLQGTCPTNTTTPEDTLSSMFEPILGDDFPLRLCEPKANPICGIDNRTYTNPCIAEFLGVKTKHTGSCEKSIEPVETPTIQDESIDVQPVTVSLEEQTVYGRSGGSSNPTIRAQQPGTSQSATTNTWVEIPISLLQSTAGTDSRIERCGYNGTITFYVHGEFPTLYNAKGEAICYPEHDIDDSCPSYITSGAYRTSCQKVSP